MSAVFCDGHREGSASHFVTMTGKVTRRNRTLQTSRHGCDGGSFLFIFKEDSTEQPDTTKYSCVTSFI